MGWTWVHGPVDRVPMSIGLFRGLKKCPPDTFLPCQGKAALFESYIWNPIPVKTTGEAGGMSKPYKGIIQPRLKAHEKFANRKCLLAAPLPGGGYFICL